MLCERCEEREATVQQIMIVDEQVTHQRLCERCAEQEETDPESTPGTSVSHVISDLFDSEESDDSARVCPECGTEFSDFQQSERLGCAHCYDAFRESLESLIHRIHGADQHVGQSTKSATPAKLSEERKVQRLEKQLSRAVENEDYEEAAKLRDKIEMIENDE